MSRLTAIISAIVICLVVCLGWLAMHYHNAAAEQKTRADSAEQQVNAAQTITSNVLTTMTIFNTIVEANQHAKEQIALDASGASADIRVAVANDDCTNRPVPAGAVKRLQQFANGLRQGAGGPLPASLTADTPQPEIPDNLTWGQSLDLNVSLLSALGQCNRDKADIRQAETKRQ